MTEQRADAFEQGVDARAQGRPQSANPYEPGTSERSEWAAGWNATFDLDEDDDPGSCRGDKDE